MSCRWREVSRTCGANRASPRRPAGPGRAEGLVQRPWWSPESACASAGPLPMRTGVHRPPWRTLPALRSSHLQAVEADDVDAVRLAAARDNDEEVAATARGHVAVEPAFARRQHATGRVHDLDTKPDVRDAVATIVVQPAADGGAAPRELIEVGIRPELDPRRYGLSRRGGAQEKREADDRGQRADRVEHSVDSPARRSAAHEARRTVNIR